MTTIYFSNKDFRADMQRKTSSTRCHAVCRHILGTATQESHWYGAHYFAACALLSEQPIRDQLRLWRQSFKFEITHEHSGRLPRQYRKLWRLAVRRVLAVRSEAMELATSVLW